MSAPTHRAETRTRDTLRCPDADHTHQWRNRRLSKTAAYDVDAAGTVRISEEALAALLRQAGYKPVADRAEESEQ